MSETKFSADYSKRASKCQKCKQELPKGSCRLAKVAPNFFHDGDGEMKQYYHIKCLFETFQRARATTKVIESTDDIDGFTGLTDDDKDLVVELIDELAKKRGGKAFSSKSNKKTATSSQEKTPKKTTLDTFVKRAKHSDDEDDSDDDSKHKAKKLSTDKAKKNTDDDDYELEKTDIEDNNDDDKKAKAKSNDSDDDDDDGDNVDNKFETFINICNRIASQSGHIAKTNITRDFITKGSDGKKYKGNLSLFIHFLLPNSKNRVYNLNSVSLLKLFSRIFHTDQDDMTKQLNKSGDVAETVKTFFEMSTSNIRPLKKSKLTLKHVDEYLNELTEITKEHDQLDFLKKCASNCTANDLEMFIKLIKKDLRINAGEKAILDAITPNAYNAFKVSRDLEDVIKRSIKLLKTSDGKPTLLKKDLSIKINLMTPVKPMLADACKSVESAIQKCPNGLFVEIKYDGERLQVHKHGNKFNYFSRNLKPVQPHKVNDLKEYIPKAFPDASDLILDGEVLLYDTKNKKPLPFGTLGKHKKNAFKDATVCYFVFDLIYYNGKDLMNESIMDRRKILEKVIKVIPGRIMLSDQQIVRKSDKLRELMMNAIKEGLEGLVLKDMKSIYEPGKRHWLKMKKDYLDAGSMADTADLVCLGAYYGTGNKGGLMSVFLTGAYNAKLDKWQTVTKVGNGFDDKALDRLQKELKVVEIHKNPAKVPSWLDVNRTLVPDFVVKDPKKAPVWEITGAEFSKSDVHTAAGISIRFPRVTRVRDDKSWEEATDVERLKELFKISKEKSDIDAKDTSKSNNDDTDIIEEDDEEDNKKATAKAKKPVATASNKVAKKRPSSDSDDDSDDDNGKSKAKQSKQTNQNPTQNLLPSVFKNSKVYLSKNCENIDKLKRYIIAYEGEIVDEYSIDDATHIVESKNIDDDEIKQIKTNLKAKKISINDLWTCIKLKKSLKT